MGEAASKPHTAAGKGVGLRPSAAPLPRQRYKGEMGGAAGVKITDPFVKGKKAKIQKKKEKS